jgi:predicted PurR-regulated permease PerM
VFIVVWDLAVKKTGGYVAARVVLAAICGSFTAAFLFLIGMPYWLALGVWTGIVSQFVPTVGTYIAIALPVVVGLTSADPVDGVLALIFALIYQQIENLTIEPRISAEAVDMHPAVAFASVILGAALFGAAGALVAVPIAALLLSLLEIYSRQYELLPQLGPPPPATSPDDGDDDHHGFTERLRHLRPRSGHGVQPQATEPAPGSDS